MRSRVSILWGRSDGSPFVSTSCADLLHFRQNGKAIRPRPRNHWEVRVPGPPKVPKIMDQDPKTESIGRKGLLYWLCDLGPRFWALLEV